MYIHKYIHVNIIYKYIHNYIYNIYITNYIRGILTNWHEKSQILFVCFGAIILTGPLIVKMKAIIYCLLG